MSKDKTKYLSLDKFDRLYGSLSDLADVTKTKPSTVVTHTPLLGQTQTFIIQTMRQKDEGDTIFIQYMADGEAIRIALPAAAADAIARQRDALGAKNRKRAAKERAQADKAQGKLPGFMRHKATVNGHAEQSKDML